MAGVGSTPDAVVVAGAGAHPPQKARFRCARPIWSRRARSRSRHVTSRGSGNEDRSRGAPPFTVAAAVPGKGARKSRQTAVSVRSLVRPSGAFRVVVPRCCSCALCCWGLLFRPCAGGATFLLGQARASVDAHLTSPHLMFTSCSCWRALKQLPKFLGPLSLLSCDRLRFGPECCFLAKIRKTRFFEFFLSASQPRHTAWMLRQVAGCTE